MTIGSDVAGSIRQPSSWCGIVSLKPTFGLVPCTGVWSMESSLDHLGPMTRTVNDCATLLQVSSLVKIQVDVGNMISSIHIISFDATNKNKRELYLKTDRWIRIVHVSSDLKIL